MGSDELLAQKSSFVYGVDPSFSAPLKNEVRFASQSFFHRETVQTLSSALYVIIGDN